MVPHLLAFVIGIALFVVLVTWLWAKVFQMYNSADGERYRRWRAQGPFVPLSEADIAEDKARISNSNH